MKEISEQTPHNYRTTGLISNQALLCSKSSLPPPAHQWETTVIEAQLRRPSSVVERKISSNSVISFIIVFSTLWQGMCLEKLLTSLQGLTFDQLVVLSFLSIGYAISGSALSWCESYLLGRIQAVLVDGQFSEVFLWPLWNPRSQDWGRFCLFYTLCLCWFSYMPFAVSPFWRLSTLHFCLTSGTVVMKRG